MSEERYVNKSLGLAIDAAYQILSPATNARADKFDNLLEKSLRDGLTLEDTAEIEGELVAEHPDEAASYYNRVATVSKIMTSGKG